jgi:hypothetical protein
MEVVSSDAFNAKLRAARGRRVQTVPAVEPEPETRPIDYGAGPRAPVAPANTNEQMRRWMAQQAHRSKLEGVTVTARGKP